MTLKSQDYQNAITSIEMRRDALVMDWGKNPHAYAPGSASLVAIESDLRELRRLQAEALTNQAPQTDDGELVAVEADGLIGFVPKRSYPDWLKEHS